MKVTGFKAYLRDSYVCYDNLCMPGRELVPHSYSPIQAKHSIPLSFNYLEIYYKFENYQTRKDHRGHMGQNVKPKYELDTGYRSLCRLVLLLFE